MAVITHPGTERDGRHLSKDVELVRASLLYADSVELISPNAGLLANVVDLAEGGELALFDALSRLDDDSISILGGGASLPANWREILPAAMLAMRLDENFLRSLPSGDLIPQSFFERRVEIEQQLENTVTQFRNSANELWTNAGGRELTAAFKAGILKISPISHSRSVPGLEGVALQWLTQLQSTLQDTSKRVLFDDAVSRLIRSLIADGTFEPSPVTMRHAQEAALGTGLIARLPTFPQAPVDELLDLRRDLRTPLVRFRTAAFDLSETLASLPFESDSTAEIDDIWLTQVAPTIVEIEEGLAEHGLIRELRTSAQANIRSLITEGSALYIGLGTFANVSEWIAATAAMGGPAVETAARAAMSRRTNRRELQRRGLYYLYEVDRRLSS